MKPAEYHLGRKTFESWESYLPLHSDIWSSINEGTNYVLSKTRIKSDWKNTVFIKGISGIRKQ